MECKVCETCFCKGCLTKWLSSNDGNKCPMKCSEEPKFRERPHKIVRNMLAELKFRCRNTQNGCQEVELDYERVLDHEETCDYALVSCQG